MMRPRLGYRIWALLLLVVTLTPLLLSNTLRTSAQGSRPARPMLEWDAANSRVCWAPIPNADEYPWGIEPWRADTYLQGIVSTTDENGVVTQLCRVAVGIMPGDQIIMPAWDNGPPGRESEVARLTIPESSTEATPTDVPTDVPTAVPTAVPTMEPTLADGELAAPRLTWDGLNLCWPPVANADEYVIPVAFDANGDRISGTGERATVGARVTHTDANGTVTQICHPVTGLRPGDEIGTLAYSNGPPFVPSDWVEITLQAADIPITPTLTLTPSLTPTPQPLAAPANVSFDANLHNFCWDAVPHADRYPLDIPSHVSAGALITQTDTHGVATRHCQRLSGAVAGDQLQVRASSDSPYYLDSPWSAALTVAAVVAFTPTATATSTPILTSTPTLVPTSSQPAPSNIESNGATVSWDAVSGATSYRLQWRNSSISNWQGMVTVNAPQASFEFDGTQEGFTRHSQLRSTIEEHTIIVRAQAIIGNSPTAWSAEVEFTLQIIPPPPAPATLPPPTITLSEIEEHNDATRLDVSWSEVSDAVGYTIRWRAEGSEEWREVMHDAQQFSHVITGLQPNAAYTLQVLARGDRHNHDHSPWRTITIPRALDKPGGGELVSPGKHFLLE